MRFALPEQPAYRLHAPTTAWVVRSLTEIGHALASGPSGSGLFLEQQADASAGLLIAPSDAWVERTVRAAATSYRLECRAADARSWATSIPSRTAGIGFLFPGEVVDPEDRSERSGGRPTSARPPVADRPRGGPTRAPVDPVVEGSGGTRGAIQAHWFPGSGGRLRVRIRFRADAVDGSGVGATWSMGTRLIREARRRTGDHVEVHVRAARRRDRREWATGELRRCLMGNAWSIEPGAAAALFGLPHFAERDEHLPTDLHAVVLGASGAGKTRFLSTVAARHIEQGSPAVVLDLHGDLAPLISGRLPISSLGRVRAIDAGSFPGRADGLAVLGSAPPDRREREVAHVVAAFRRLAGDGSETYWGPRLERVFDSVVRAAQEEGGDLLDVHALLTDPRRRDAARLSSRNTEVVRFLEELPAILRRNPEFLWTAAARTAKLALDPRLARLVAPPGPGIDAEGWLERGGSILWRLPMGELGPEGAQLVANLLLARIYLGQTAMNRSAGSPPLLLVLDEAHAFSPALVVELLAEGRKFGIRAVLATQYPERLAPAVRAAAAGSAGAHVVFRVPAAAVASIAPWVGLTRVDAEELLPQLPPGAAVVASSRTPGPVLRPAEAAAVADPTHWTRVSTPDRTPQDPDADLAAVDPVDEAVLLAVVASETVGTRAGTLDILRWITEAPVLDVDPASVADRVHVLVRRRWLEGNQHGWTLTSAGAVRLGFSSTTGAPSESSEHRLLLLLAFRIFARNGARLEILRQGRFDTRLPDARMTVLSERHRNGAATELAARIQQLRGSWAWRAFDGRDVFVEAEVSGAERPERIVRGWSKARAAGAAVVFLVADGRRAEKVRRVLRREDLDARRAQVWTLRGAAAVRPSPPPPE